MMLKFYRTLVKPTFFQTNKENYLFYPWGNPGEHIELKEKEWKKYKRIYFYLSLLYLTIFIFAVCLSILAMAMQAEILVVFNSDLSAFYSYAIALHLLIGTVAMVVPMHFYVSKRIIQNREIIVEDRNSISIDGLLFLFGITICSIAVFLTESNWLLIIPKLIIFLAIAFSAFISIRVYFTKGHYFSKRKIKAMS